MALDLMIWWAALVLLGIAVLPALPRFFPRFPDRGLPFAKPLSLITLTYVEWLATSLGLDRRAALALVPLLALALWRRRTGAEGLPWREHFLQEGLFLSAFLFFAGVRALSPEIYGAEKYMDFAFFNSGIRTDRFPPEDPWLSGVPINYYYFGYLLFSNLGRLTQVPPAIAYNLSIATLGAVLFTAATSIGRSLTGSLRFGLLGGLAAAVLGNLDAAVQLIGERKGLAGFDFWRSSRVVPHTINEFPFFSLLHGDLHPHLTATLIDVPLIALVMAAWQDAVAQPGAPLRETLARPLRLALVALLLTAIALTNPWDLPVAFAFLGLIVTNRLWTFADPLRSTAVITLGLVGLASAMVLLSLPFNLHFHAPFQGIGHVRDRTTLIAFSTVFGLLLLPAVVFTARTVNLPRDSELRDLALAGGTFAGVALYIATGNAVLILSAALVVASGAVLLGSSRDEEIALPFAFLGVAALALFACEVVYLRDSYGSELHRMNTVFKLYFQAWLFLALAFPDFVRRWLSGLRAHPVREGMAQAVLAAGIAAALCYPAAAVATRWQNGPGKLSLDGLGYLDRDHPDDAAAIRWLGSQVGGRPVVLEATGDPYSYFARVSSNTGFPTVLGWANHEGVWRGADPRLAARTRDVGILYETTDHARTRALLERYHVRFVFVGDLERKRFPEPGLVKFASHPESFTAVFGSGGTTVFEVR